jgi:hypothetical protein
MSYIAAVLAIPLTSMDNASNSMALATKRDSTEAKGALHPIAWARRDDANYDITNRGLFVLHLFNTLLKYRIGVATAIGRPTGQGQTH